MEFYTFISKAKKIIFFFLLITYFYDVRSQVSVSGTPESFLLNTKAAKVISDTQLDTIHISSLLAADSADNIPNRYGVVQQLGIDIKSAGTKTEITGKGTIWQYEINSPQAYSLGIRFSTFNLPEGAKVFIYNETNTQVAGAFTALNNHADNKLSIAEFTGTNAIIEYFEPLGAAFSGQLVLGSVSQAYKDIQSSSSSTSSSSSRVGINCTQGSSWQDAKHSVCRITFNDTEYTYICTGFLVNNIREDGTPYFQTANHCLSSDDEASTLVAYFNYENSTCSGSDASLSQSLSGATLKATNSYTDFTLLELTETPPTSYSPYYAGWDASSRSPQAGTCIHHPQGTAKCISLDYSAPTSYNGVILWDNSTTTAKNTHWDVTFNVGNTESGSSGSPLFDDNQRAIGQLHGGDDTESFYGKFSLSWDYSSTSSQQLKTWLDPDNTGTEQLDGSFLIAPVAAFSASYTSACVNSTITLTDGSKYDPTQWNWTIEPSTYTFVNSTSSSSQNPQVYFSVDGTYTVTLIATNSYGADTAIYTNYITVKDSIEVSLSGIPSSGTICGSKLDSYPIVASGAADYTFSLDQTDKINYTTSADSMYLTLVSGVSEEGSFTTWIKVTGTFGSCSASDSAKMYVILQTNDDIANAIRLWPGSSGTAYSNECATTETDEPHPDLTGCYTDNSWCSTSDTLENTIWFTFVGPASGKITIDTKGFNDRIAVYKADSYSDILSGNSSQYELVAANDDRSSSDETSYLENIPVEYGKTYWLQVDGTEQDTGSCSFELLSTSLDIYPNPSDGQFNIIISDYNEGTAILKVYSVLGKLLYTAQQEVTMDSNLFTMDLSSFASGVYYLEVYINGNRTKAKLMIVK
jgi:PKD repeat protein